VQTKQGDGRLLLGLRRGEEIHESIIETVANHQIGHAIVSGIGAIEDVVIGAYLLDEREYVRRELEGGWEVLSLTGNVGWLDGKPFPHLHVVVSDRDCNVLGGHLFSARVHVTLELVLWTGPERLRRSFDEETGLKLWDLDGGST